MASSRFGSPKSFDEECRILQDSTPKNTAYNTKWAIKVFEEWQSTRRNKDVKNEVIGFGEVDLANVQHLSCRIEEMSAETLNFWLTKFIDEARNKNGGRYPPKTLYLLVCGLNRHLKEIQTERNSYFNVLDKSDRRFMVFRKALDAEMKDASRCGIAQRTSKEEREEITEAEEAKLWEKGLLGASTAESLLHTIYFYNGKLFGLRAGEHRLLRVSNIVIKDNYIIFDESVSKTFQGGLKDLTKAPRYIKHLCHNVGDAHETCLQSMYSMYLSKVSSLAMSVDAFYFRPNRKGEFEYEKSPVGLNMLNNILPEKLCVKAGLKRKTFHSLRITLATRLFQNSVEEKLTRERTGHRSNALFSYQKASQLQVDTVSKVLGPCTSTSEIVPAESKIENSSVDTGNNSPLAPSFGEEMFSDLFDISDEGLANIAMPNDTHTVVDNVCRNAVFNNCTINFVDRNK